MRLRVLRNGAATLLLALLATTVTSLSSAPAQAATPHYVGIVISGQLSTCVKWHSGITGDEILNDVATVGYRPDGLIVQINGSPAKAKADVTHYWAYYHDTGSTWQYSNLGPSSYSPKAGTVEGWSYINGSNTAYPPSAKASGLYASLCGAKDAPVSTPTAPHPTSKAAVSAAAAGSPTSATAHTSAAGSRAAGTSTAHTAHAAVSGGSTATGKSSAATTGGASATGAGASPSSIRPSDAGNAERSQSGSAAPTLIVAGLVVALTAGTGIGAWQRRRSRSSA